MKPNILVCSTTTIQSYELLWDFLPEDEIGKLDGFQAEEEDEKDKPQDLVWKIFETPVANFIVTNEISDYEPNLFEGMTMPEYVRKVEAELEAKKLPKGAPGKIDVIWYLYSDIGFGSEAEHDFIRSAAVLPNALIISDYMSMSSDRSDLRKLVDEQTAIAGAKRFVLKGYVLSTLGSLNLATRTRDMYLDSVNATAKEKKAYSAAWKKFLGERIEAWNEETEEETGRIIDHAAGHANFILAKPSNLSLNEMIEEGVFLLGELVEILNGGSADERRPGKLKLAHAAELRENIVTMIYEIATCYGIAADKKSVDMILHFSRANALPGNAAAVTYAAGKVAKAFFVPGIEYTEDDILGIAREAKREARLMKFRPYDYDNPNSDPDDDDDDDDDLDELFDGETDELQAALNELPEDARGTDEDAAPAEDAGKRKKAGNAQKTGKSKK